MTLAEVKYNFNVVHFSELPEQMLINRVDSKYFFNKNIIEEILLMIKNDYSIVDYGNGLINDYYTKYYDTENMIFFNMHHNRKNNRLKVRQRTYVNSKLNYFEVKHKINKRTIKEREVIKNSEILTSLKPSIKSKLKDFEDKYFTEDIKLKKTLVTKFDRITLVNKEKDERVTIDFNLIFKTKSSSMEMNNLVVLELKQSKINRSSIAYKTLRERGVFPTNFSKYFVGISLLNKKVKLNNFKPIRLKLKKLNIGEFND